MALEEKRKEAERKAETFQEAPNEVGKLYPRKFIISESCFRWNSNIPNKFSSLSEMSSARDCRTMGWRPSSVFISTRSFTSPRIEPPRYITPSPCYATSVRFLAQWLQTSSSESSRQSSPSPSFTSWDICWRPWLPFLPWESRLCKCNQSQTISSNYDATIRSPKFHTELSSVQQKNCDQC